MPRILIVDDEDLVRNLMVEILERADFEVDGAATAEDALALLEQDVYDLVVTDAVMPRFSGFELVRELRRRWPRMPVIVATGATTESTITEARAAGANDVLTKPFSHAELIGAIRSALEGLR